VIKIVAFLVIAGLAIGLFYLSYLYITGKKFVKQIPKALFFGGPLHGENLVVGPHKDVFLINIPSHTDEKLYAVYKHDGFGFYDWDDNVWESEVDLDKSNVVSYNGLTNEQEETDDTSNNSGKQD